MLSLIFIISLILTVVLSKKFDFVGAILSVVVAIIFGFLTLGVSIAYIDIFNVDNKIEIYIEENKKIESDVSIAVGNYQTHENSILKKS